MFDIDDILTRTMSEIIISWINADGTACACGLLEEDRAALNDLAVAAKKHSLTLIPINC